MMLMIGNFSHLFYSSFDFVSESHFVQLVDPFSILTVPFRHFMQSQEHGEVISWYQAKILMNRRITGCREFSIVAWTNLP